MNKFLFLILIFPPFFWSQNYQWVKHIGLPGYDDSQSILTDNQNNLYITGAYQGVVDFDPGALTTTVSSGGVYILKLDSLGNFLWVKSFDMSISTFCSIAIDSTNGVYIAGSFPTGVIDLDPGPGIVNASSTLPGYTTFVVRLDSAGNYIWGKTFGGGQTLSHKITIDHSGNVLIIGIYNGSSGPVDFDPGPGLFNLTTVNGQYDAFILKLDGGGNFVWAKAINGPGDENLSGIKTDYAGNIFFSGYYNHTNTDFDPGPLTFTVTTQGSADIYVLKLDAFGNFGWVRTMGGSSADYSFDLAIDSLDNIYVVGDFKMTADFDPGFGVFNLTATGQRDGYICKLNSAGNFVWANVLNGTNQSQYLSIHINSASEILATGSFKGVTDFNTGPAVLNFTSTGIHYNAFISKLDSSGNFSWTKTLIAVSNQGASYGVSVVSDYWNNTYITGAFNDTIDFDPDAGTELLSSSGNSRDIYILKLGRCNTLLNTISNQTICNSETTTIFATGAYSYTWIPGGFNTPSITVNPTTTTTYTVFGPKSDDCDASARIAVNVETCTNLSERALDYYSIYPNPNDGEFLIKGATSNTLKIIDELGRLIQTIQLDQNNNYEFRISNLNAGIYFILSETLSQKIVVTK